MQGGTNEWPHCNNAGLSPHVQSRIEARYGMKALRERRGLNQAMMVFIPQYGPIETGYMYSPESVILSYSPPVKDVLSVGR